MSSSQNLACSRVRLISSDLNVRLALSLLLFLSRITRLAVVMAWTSEALNYIENKSVCLCIWGLYLSYYSALSSQARNLSPHFGFD